MGMGGGTSTTTTTQELSPEQRALIAPVIPIAKRQLANPPKMFPGTGIAGFTSPQIQAQQMTMAAANQLSPVTSQIPKQFQALMAGMPQAGAGAQRQVQQMVAGLQPGTNFLTSGRVLRPESNPALQGAIDAATRPIMQNWREQIMPGITQEGVASGGFGGTRQGIAEGLTGSRALQTVGDVSSSMANTNYQAGLDAMIGGLNAALGQQQNILGGGQLNLAAQQAAGQLLGQAGNILPNTLLPAQMKEAVGGQQQAMNQARLSEQVSRFVNQQMIPFSVAQDVAAMAFGMPGGTTRSTSTQPGNPMMGAQMGMGALSMLPMLLKGSDRRLKENVKAVKKLADGLIIYVFNYIGERRKTIGLMADEVEQVYPDAVSVGKNGYKRVNYLAIPTWLGAY